MSLGKMLAVIEAVIGFIMGIFVAAFAPFASSFGEMGPFSAAALGLLVIIILPVILAIVGFVMGVVTAFVYNEVAKRFGGIKLDL
jgi:Na+/H+-dicarboxylate symporter